ncbi:hypothetical protein B0H21DRAFT_819841 [Amylocystis lapponica]|nr:hypothetical protein B0H21DRAFT_819841 [Amylocystis lapponica]
MNPTLARAASAPKAIIAVFNLVEGPHAASYSDRHALALVRQLHLVYPDHNIQLQPMITLAWEERGILGRDFGLEHALLTAAKSAHDFERKAQRVVILVWRMGES